MHSPYPAFFCFFPAFFCVMSAPSSIFCFCCPALCAAPPRPALALFMFFSLVLPLSSASRCSCPKCFVFFFQRFALLLPLQRLRCSFVFSLVLPLSSASRCSCHIIRSFSAFPPASACAAPPSSSALRCSSPRPALALFLPPPALALFLPLFVAVLAQVFPALSALSSAPFSALARRHGAEEAVSLSIEAPSSSSSPPPPPPPTPLPPPPPLS